MSNPHDALQVLNDEFLELRSKLLQIAAQLDRLDRADGSVADDPRIQSVRLALDILAGSDPGRAEQVQLVFSRRYDPDWKQKFEPAKQ